MYKDLNILFEQVFQYNSGVILFLIIDGAIFFRTNFSAKLQKKEKTKEGKESVH